MGLGILSGIHFFYFNTVYMNKRAYDLEERLINFAVLIIKLVSHFPNSDIGKHLGNQLQRSATAPALNYGEAQGAESPADFLHKMRICLKELRESQINLKISFRSGLLSKEDAKQSLDECGQLVAIFTSSVKTATEKAKLPRKP